MYPRASRVFVLSFVYYIYSCICIMSNNTTGFSLLKDILHLLILCIIRIKTRAGSLHIGSNALVSLQFAYIGYLLTLNKQILASALLDLSRRYQVTTMCMLSRTLSLRPRMILL